MKSARINLVIVPSLVCALALSTGCLQRTDTHSDLEYRVEAIGADLIRIYFLDEYQVLRVLSTGSEDVPWSSFHHMERGRDAEIWVEAVSEEPAREVCVTVQTRLDGKLWLTSSQCGPGRAETGVGGNICKEGECSGEEAGQCE
jgi:hypothetical protein